MFNKKYIFETKKTRNRRIVINLGILASLGFFVYTAFAIYILYFAANLRESAEKNLFKNSPDAIVVLTGDGGRIPFAFKLLKKHPESHLFITGVYTKNSIQTLVKKNLSIEGFDVLDQNKIEIDYLATNTVENVLSTIRFLKQKNEFNKILVVSSDYHILRVKMAFDKLTKVDDPYIFNYWGIESELDDFRSFKIISKEVFKIVKAWGFLILWESEAS